MLQNFMSFGFVFLFYCTLNIMIFTISSLFFSACDAFLFEVTVQSRIYSSITHERFYKHVLIQPELLIGGKFDQRHHLSLLPKSGYQQDERCDLDAE